METGYTAIKRGHAAKWLQENPVLEVGEPGYESNTGKFKIGDGVTEWADLPYFINSNLAIEQHEDRLDLHTSGQRTGLAKNETGTGQTVGTSNTLIPGTSILLPQIDRPQVLEGKVTFKCSVAMTVGQGTSIGLYIVDDLGNFLESAMEDFTSATTACWQTMDVSYDIEADAAERTYHLECVRVGATSGTFVTLNGAIAPSHRSRLRARAA